MVISIFFSKMKNLGFHDASNGFRKPRKRQRKPFDRKGIGWGARGEGKGRGPSLPLARAKRCVSDGLLFGRHGGIFKFIGQELSGQFIRRHGNQLLECRQGGAIDFLQQALA